MTQIKLNSRKLTMIITIFMCEFLASAFVCYVFLAYEPRYTIPYAFVVSDFQLLPKTIFILCNTKPETSSEHRTCFPDSCLLCNHFLQVIANWAFQDENGNLRWDNLIGIILLFSIIAIAAIVIIVSAVQWGISFTLKVKVAYFFSITKTLMYVKIMSARSRKMHTQLFTALLVQVVIFPIVIIFFTIVNSILFEK